MSDIKMPNRVPEIRTVAMPADANPDGDIFNGKVLNLVHQLHLPKNPLRQDNKNNKR